MKRVEMVANTIVVIILQFINVSDQHLQLKLTRCCVLIISIKLEKINIM